MVDIKIEMKVKNSTLFPRSSDVHNVQMSSKQCLTEYLSHFVRNLTFFQRP